VLTDATVSRYHLEIRVRRDGIEIAISIRPTGRSTVARGSAASC